MNRQRCKELFYRLVFPSHPNEWEVDEVMEHLAALPAAQQESLFAQVPVIWPVSHSLCFAFLEEAADNGAVVPSHLVADWVRAILGRYESGGLVKARGYITHARTKFLEPFRARNRVTFEDISARMTFYIRGVSGRNLELAPAEVCSTDTRTLFLPPVIDLLPQRSQNELLYKLLVSMHWAFIRLGTLRCAPSAAARNRLMKRYEPGAEAAELPAMESCFRLFPDPLLARDSFFVLEAARAMAWIRTELPGLAGQVGRLAPELDRIFPVGAKTEPAAAVAGRAGAWVFGIDGGTGRAGAAPAGEPAATDDERITQLRVLYDELSRPDDVYRRPPLLELLGVHDFERAEAEIGRKRAETREAFVAQLARLLETAREETGAEGQAVDPGGAEAALLVMTETSTETGRSERAITIDNRSLEIPDELKALLSDIEADLGQVPPSYFSAASGLAGRGVSSGRFAAPEESGPPEHGELLFDEWDYRRNGYRKNWCRLYEKDLPALRSTFVATTLDKHRGLLVRLKRQFEMMRVNEHFVRRQREGNDLDLDAIIEARGDHRAGVSPTDRLFIRLQRNERDIATLFLVDMSNSTEGWVGTVIKEALVLLCEAMDVVGDRYGIYGFSGMRRSRCEIFPVKHLEESAGRVVHRRIGSIMPREYTRLGPAIRYAAARLRRCEARTRLLVTITDGKPEDYDDYKGTYAIEDTRKALLEARGGGLHAFCITVDRQAHDYLPHMFGAGNYIFVDDIRKLPFRMIDMYRLLTA